MTCTEALGASKSGTASVVLAVLLMAGCMQADDPASLGEPDVVPCPLVVDASDDAMRVWYRPHSPATVTLNVERLDGGAVGLWIDSRPQNGTPEELVVSNKWHRTLSVVAFENRAVQIDHSALRPATIGSYVVDLPARATAQLEPGRDWRITMASTPGVEAHFEVAGADARECHTFPRPMHEIKRLDPGPVTLGGPVIHTVRAETGNHPAWVHWCALRTGGGTTLVDETLGLQVTADHPVDAYVGHTYPAGTDVPYGACVLRYGIHQHMEGNLTFDGAAHGTTIHSWWMLFAADEAVDLPPRPSPSRHP